MSQEAIWPYTWADTAARLFAGSLTHVFVEFANLAAPGDTLAPPTLVRTDGLSYYQALSADPVRDYLRVPLLGTPTLDVDTTAAGATSLAAGQVNRLTATALAAGSTGVNGKTFASSANSTVVGVALVSAPDPTDPSLDVVNFRAYYDTTQQSVVPASGVVLVTHAVTFP